MRKLLTAALTAGLLISTAGASLAGSIFNEHTVRNTKGDTRAVIRSQESVDGVKVVQEKLYKIDSVGEQAGAFLQFRGDKVQGRAFATNVENPDPFVILGQTSMRDRSTYSSNTEATIYDNSWYTERSEQYTLGTSY